MLYYTQLKNKIDEQKSTYNEEVTESQDMVRTDMEAYEEWVWEMRGWKETSSLSRDLTLQRQDMKQLHYVSAESEIEVWE